MTPDEGFLKNESETGVSAGAPAPRRPPGLEGGKGGWCAVCGLDLVHDGGAKWICPGCKHVWLLHNCPDAESAAAPRPPGPPDSPDRCKCGAVTLWRNPSPDASATDPLTRIVHTRKRCERAAAAAPDAAPPDEPCANREGDHCTLQAPEGVPIPDGACDDCDMQAPTPEEPPVREHTIRICDQCLRLEGEQCNNPACVFCRRTMAEVGEYLDVLLIRPVVNGERLPAPTGAAAAPDAAQKRPPPISEEARRQREPLSPWPGVIPVRAPPPDAAPPDEIAKQSCPICGLVECRHTLAEMLEAVAPRDAVRTPEAAPDEIERLVDALAAASAQAAVTLMSKPMERRTAARAALLASVAGLRDRLARVLSLAEEWERKVVVGRAWTEEQAIWCPVLIDCARALRAALETP